ncbi:MAG: LptE family protein [Nitrospirae bacterium]|nr:LptE family protein [Nitrospirota bacterium]
MKPIIYYYAGLALPTLLCALFIVAGCGYHMAGRGGHLPGGAKTIAIPVFSNKTLEPIVEEELTPAVIREFMKDGRIEVVDSSRADVILMGSVVSYTESPLSFDSNQNVLEYRITVTTQLRLVRQSLPLTEGGKGKGEILWEKDITTSAEYSVSSDVMSTKVSKLLALKEIARNLAEEATDRVLWGW